MPSSLSSTLQTRLGPAPVWVWLLGGGATIYLLPKLTGIFGKSQSSVPAKTPNQGVPSGWVPAGSQPPPSPSSSVSSPPDTPFNPADWTEAWPGGGFEYRPGGSYGTYVKNGTAYTHIGNTTNLGALQNAGTPVYYFPAPGVPARTAVGLQVSYWTASSVKTGVGSGWIGRGGPNPSVGSRSANLMHSGHPLIKQPVRYPHYVVAGKGGPTSVHSVARMVGLHPARIMAVNSANVRGQIPHGHVIRVS